MTDERDAHRAETRAPFLCIAEDNAAAQGICEWAAKRDRHVFERHQEDPRPDCWYCTHSDGEDHG